MHFNQRLFLIAAMAMTMSSCATLMNSPRKKITIRTNEPVSVTVDSDTLWGLSSSWQKVVPRRDTPVTITVFNDQRQKTVSVQPRNSAAYWLNAVPSVHLWTGFLIDRNKQKRYTYPGTIYIDLKSSDSSYSKPPPSHSVKHPQRYAPSGIKNLVKFSPLRVMNPVNPAIAFHYERVTGKFYSTTVGAGWILPSVILETRSPSNRGFTVSLEERRYFRPAPLNKFVGLELFYLHNNYKDVELFAPEGSHYWNSPDDEQYTDSIGIRKRSIALNARAGIQMVGKKLSFEVSAGLGIKYRHVVHTDRINPEHKSVGTRHFNVGHISNQEGNLVRPNLVVDIRLGWRL